MRRILTLKGTRAIRLDGIDAKDATDAKNYDLPSKGVMSMIYGHLADPTRSTKSSTGPFELSEVSFAVEPALLREIAQFLNSAADELERDPKLSVHWHMHLADESETWRQMVEDHDVIVVCPPDYRASEHVELPHDEE
jgi:hypothetical protein